MIKNTYKTMNPFLKKRGIIVKTFANLKLLKEVTRIIKIHFSKSDEHYCQLPIEKFHNIALKCQNHINKINVQKIFIDSEKKFIRRIFKNDTPMISSVVTLRVVRPQNKIFKNGEALGWHRETFYGKNKYIQHGMNVWIPVLNVSKNNNLGYIPKSHLIDDKKIIRRKFKQDGYVVKKFSSAHKLGFPYAPKKIISGVNIKSADKINVQRKSYAIFSQLLVHGNAQNLSNKIRYAINLGIVPKSKLIRNRKIDKRKFNLKNKKNLLYKEL